MQPRAVLQHFEEMRLIAKALGACKDHSVAAAAVVIEDNMVTWSSPDMINEAPEYCRTSKHCAKFSGRPCNADHAEVRLQDWINGNLTRPWSFTHIMVTYQPCEQCAARLRAYGKPILFLEKSRRPIPQGCEWYFSSNDGIPPWSELFQQIYQYHRNLNSPNLAAAKESDENKYRQIREASLALFMEVAELVDTHQWKPWRAARVYERQHFREEMADIVFFMSSLMELHDIPESELRQAIADKLIVNNNRIEKGYHS